MSSMFRNLGSALTLGGMETTRAKEARERYIERYGRHEQRHEAYIGFATETSRKLEDLRKEAQRARETVIEVGALAVGDDGNLQAGWYPLEASPHANAAGGAERGAIPGGAGAVAAGIGVPAAAWAAVGALGAASTGAAISGLSGATAAGGLGMAAAPLALTGIGLLATAPVLGVDFWRTRQRERDRLDAIQESTDQIEQREAEMQNHRSRLETILPEISPAIDELASSASDAKSANDSRLATISEMRSTLEAQCAKVAEALQETTSAIENVRGSRQELRAISDRSRDVTSAAAELQTESNRQESAVNEETNRTTAVLNKLAAAIETADEIISNSRKLLRMWTPLTPAEQVNEQRYLYAIKLF